MHNADTPADAVGNCHSTNAHADCNNGKSYANGYKYCDADADAEC
ncbi:hypothetical protein [Arthrobacter sp. yr096]|nr:hypothetical protein [Arthrobacter sp. yr096]